MTRRRLFQMLAGLPVVGRLVVGSRMHPIADSPVTIHYVAFSSGRSDVNPIAPHRYHSTIGEAIAASLPGDFIIFGGDPVIPRGVETATMEDVARALVRFEIWLDGQPRDVIFP